MGAIRLYWVVGELSGERYAALLARALRERLPTLRMRGMGSALLQTQGMELFTSWEHYTVVGFIEVFRHLPKFIRLYRSLQKDILTWKPHRVILVDYPGLNLRLLSWLRSQNIPVTYFIPPQLWAWGTGRVRHLHRAEAQLLCILPFEPAFYKKFGVQATYVGHPLVSLVDEAPPFQAPRPYIALLPGSRPQEIKAMLPIMAQLPVYFPQWDFYVSRVAHLPLELYQRWAKHIPLVEVPAASLLKGAQAAILTSGTVTLEAALAGCPGVIVYKGNPLSYHIAKRLVRVPYIGLPNLIAGERLYPELIQGDFTVKATVQALREVLGQREALQARLQALRTELGEKSAVENAAAQLLSAIDSTARSEGYSGEGDSARAKLDTLHLSRPA
ncbi:MAG: lipid-A-disaccharide synthase [Bacteroidia bacterium]|nr:lipid-A-disaccharide synthase [Bacteroidia bacterium]MDW8235704.1 lipid-A-disaccharide synthase [Bacteroidia bacterium]